MSISADASASTIAFVEESNWGLTPATPVFKQIRQTGNGLQPTFSKVVSDEITPSASIGDVIPTSGGAEGDVNFEPSYGVFMDTFLAHALRNSFDAYGILKGGSATKQMTLERILTKDATAHYFRYAGSRINTLSLTLDSQATTPVNGTINVMSKTEDALLTTDASAYEDANTNPVMSMPEVRELYAEIDGVEVTACYTSLSLSLTNNLRMQQGKCTNTTSYPDLTAKGEGYGRREITLDVGYDFSGLDYVDMYKNNTSGVISFIMTDGTHGYKITFPRIKILESAIPVEGNNTDIVQNMTVQALNDTASATDIIVEKVGNLASGAGVKLTGTSPSVDVQGTFYKDGTQNDSKDVYQSVDLTAEVTDEATAIWWDTTDACWYVTAYSEIGDDTNAEWKNTNATDPTGAFTAVAGATGTLSGASYDPTA